MKMLLAATVLFASVLSVHATTLIYQGNAYDQTNYTPPPPNAILSSGPPLRGPYDSSMSLSATFFVDTTLAPNTSYSFSDIAGPIGWNILAMDDGINDLTAVGGLFPALNFVTDASAQILSWNWSVVAITGETASSSSSGGDMADYQADYTFTTAAGGTSCCVSEIASASSAAIGTWTIVPPPPTIPLPGSGLALLAGLAGIALLRRRA